MTEPVPKKMKVMKCKTNFSSVITPLVHLRQQLSMNSLESLDVEEQLETLHQHMKETKKELQTVWPLYSQEEQSAWSASDVEELSSIMGALEPSELKRYKTSLMSLLETHPAPLSSSVGTGRTGATYTQSMIAPTLMGVAGVSMGSFLDVKTLQDINSQSHQKSTSKMHSTITCRSGGGSVTSKWPEPNGHAEYLLTISLLDVKDVLMRGVKPEDYWKNTVFSAKYYGTADGPEKTPQGRTLLEYSKMIEVLLNKDCLESNPTEGSESI